jgi:hypothetical protein
VQRVVRKKREAAGDSGVLTEIDERPHTA